MEQNKYSEGTISVRVNNLRTYFKYLHDIKHYLFKFPMKNVKVNFKNRVKIPNFLSEAQARTLLEHYANSDNPLDIRNNAIFHIFLYSFFSYCWNTKMLFILTHFASAVNFSF